MLNIRLEALALTCAFLLNGRGPLITTEYPKGTYGLGARASDPVHSRQLWVKDFKL